jgi:holo-[acyl-carrier protein] synthase
MVQGIGSDIIEISRIRASIERHHEHFINKIFTKHEIGYCTQHRDPIPRYAGRFAAKEAIAKALGKGFREGIGWHDIEIMNNADGMPYVNLSSELQATFDNPKIIITISHCREYATATALWL